MTESPTFQVIAQGRYIGTILETVTVQNEHGYSTAYRIRYQREVLPNTGWFLARDVQYINSTEGAA